MSKVLATYCPRCGEYGTVTATSKAATCSECGYTERYK